MLNSIRARRVRIFLLSTVLFAVTTAELRATQPSITIPASTVAAVASGCSLTACALSTLGFVALKPNLIEITDPAKPASEETDKKPLIPALLDLKQTIREELTRVGTAIVGRSVILGCKVTCGVAAILSSGCALTSLAFWCYFKNREK